MSQPSTTGSSFGSRIIPVAPHHARENIIAWLESQGDSDIAVSTDNIDLDVKAADEEEEDDDRFLVEELDEFVVSHIQDLRKDRLLKRDGRKCVLCGWPAETLCHVLRSNLHDRQGLRWLHHKSMVPISFNFNDDRNLLTFCFTHHVEWAKELFGFIPTQQDLTLILDHEESGYQRRQNLAANGQIEPRTPFPKLSGLYNFVNIGMPHPYLSDHNAGIYQIPLLFDISNTTTHQSPIPPLAREFTLSADAMALMAHTGNAIVHSPRPFPRHLSDIFDVLESINRVYERPQPLPPGAQPSQSKEQAMRNLMLSSNHSYWKLGPHLSSNDAAIIFSQTDLELTSSQDMQRRQDDEFPLDDM